MKKKDFQLLEEQYQTVQEGLWDRIKARGAGALGSIKGAGNQIAGTVKGALAGARGNVPGVQAAQAQKQAGAGAGLDARSLSIVNSHIKKIETAIQSFQTDMTKLGLDPKTMQSTNPQAAAALQALSGALNNLKSRLQPTGQVGKAVANVGTTPPTA